MCLCDLKFISSMPCMGMPQNRVADPKELDFHAAVSLLMWMRGNESGYSERAANTLTLFQ